MESKFKEHDVIRTAVKIVDDYDDEHEKGSTATIVGCYGSDEYTIEFENGGMADIGISEIENQ